MHERFPSTMNETLKYENTRKNPFAGMQQIKASQSAYK